MLCNLNRPARLSKLPLHPVAAQAVAAGRRCAWGASCEGPKLGHVAHASTDGARRDPEPMQLPTLRSLAETSVCVPEPVATAVAHGGSSACAWTSHAAVDEGLPASARKVMLATGVRDLDTGRIAENTDEQQFIPEETFLANTTRKGVELPTGWTECHSPSRGVYFSHSPTGVTQWDFPTGPPSTAQVEQVKAERGQRLEVIDGTWGVLERCGEQAVADPGFDDNGRRYSDISTFWGAVEEHWYGKVATYWSKEEPSNDGVLGGLSETHEPDLATSRRFLEAWTRVIWLQWVLLHLTDKDFVGLLSRLEGPGTIDDADVDVAFVVNVAVKYYDGDDDEDDDDDDDDDGGDDAA
eukprot:s142_g10.t3